MLRLLVGLLLLANLVFWATTRDDVAQALGLVSTADRDPERLARQVRPEAIRVLNPAGAAASAASAPAVAPLSCIESGALDEQQAAAAIRELQQAGVPAGAWVDMRRELPGRWLLYMGRFTDREAMRRKGVELARMNLPFEELLDGSEFSPGLVLAEFDNDTEALSRLAQLRQRGVRTARVVQPGTPRIEHRLRVDRLSADRSAQLQALGVAGADAAGSSGAASAAGSAPATAARWTVCGA